MKKFNLDFDLPELVSDSIDSLFVIAHLKAGTKSGDITPLQSEELDNIKDRLIELMGNQISQNLPQVPFKDMFWDMDKLPADLKKLFAPVEYQDGLSYAQCANLLHDAKKLGYTFDYGLDGVPFALRPIGIKLNQIEGFEDEEE